MFSSLKTFFSNVQKIKILWPIIRSSIIEYNYVQDN